MNFDNIITLYNSQLWDECEQAIYKLKRQEERNFLYFLYANKEHLNPGLFSFVLDCIY